MRAASSGVGLPVQGPEPAVRAQITQPPPAPMPVPGFLPVYTAARSDGHERRQRRAAVTLSRNGVVQFSFPSWGYQHLVGLTPPFSTGETSLVDTAALSRRPAERHGTIGVLPCSPLPAPGVDPVQAGDTSVALTSFVPTRIKVFVNSVKRGRRGGPVVPFTKRCRAATPSTCSRSWGPASATWCRS